MPVSSGRKSGRFRETRLQVGFVQERGRSKRSGSVIEGFSNYDQNGDNLDELATRPWQGVCVGTFSTTTWIRRSIADGFPPIMVL